MKKLKCTSCGGNMTIDANNEYATCSYCGTKYKLNQDINVNLNIDEDIKEVFIGTRQMGKFGLIIILPIIVFIFIFVISNILFDRRVNEDRVQIEQDYEDTKNNMQQIQEELKNNEENIDEFENKVSTSSFNWKLEMHSGVQSKFFVEILLSDVIASNNKNKEQLIEVVIGNRSTKDMDEIIDIRKTLSQEEYTVIFDYDEKGYINKVTLK